MVALTPKQKKVFDYIAGFTEKKGYAPSQKEIAEHFKFKSLGTVQEYLVQLQRRGHLSISRNAQRGLLVVVPPVPTSNAVPLPLLGRVAAGFPIEAIESPDSIDVPASMVGAGDHFVLKVSGYSMKDDGILDGDYVVIRKQEDARNGETVVALVGNEATIKRFYRRKGNVELHPANPAFEPLVISSLIDAANIQQPQLQIRGVMVGLIRRLQ